jgi:hypothetical protein
MEHVQTTIYSGSVHLRYANDADPDQATEWFEAEVPLDDLKHPAAPEAALGEPERRYVLEIQAAVLVRVRDAVQAEIQRLGQMRLRSP